MSNAKKALLSSMEAMTAKMAAGLQNAGNTPEVKLLTNDQQLMRVNIRDIEAYDRNPRTEENPEFENIKASIRAKGLESILTITKRPGNDKYILAKGGKTRLRAIKELSIDDARWQYLECLYVPYTNETDLLSSHLSENMMRGEMSFWDSANGVVVMRDTMQMELGKQIGKTELQEEFKKMGVVFDVNYPNEALFAVQFYSSLGQLAQKITRNDIRRELRPHFNQLRDLWLKHPGHTEETFEVHYQDFVSLYQAQNDAYSANALIEFVQNECASALSIDTALFTRLLTLLARKEHKDASLDLLNALAQALELPTTSLTDAQARQTGRLTGTDSNDNDSGSGSGTTNNTQGAAPKSAGLLALEATLAKRGASLGQNDADHEDSKDFDDFSLSDKPVVGFAGVQGLEVSDGKNLIRTYPNNPAAKKPPHELFQDLLTQMLLRAGLMELAVGIPESPTKTLGMFIELPEQPIDDPYAVQVWWAVAAMTGQLIRPLDLSDVPDGRFKSVFGDLERNSETVWELFGDMPDDAANLVSILTNPKHPLCDDLVELHRLLRMSHAGGDA
jgi:ParB family protein of integrating conjugative element (PFGI_1 class)